MKRGMEQAQRRLRELLQEHEVTDGMYVRVHGENLIVGRNEQVRDDAPPEPSDRVRLTRLTPKKFGLSVKRHTGRWEKTPFTGTLDEVVSAILACMQHLVAPY